MDSNCEMTSISDLCNEVKDTAQKLLNHYVKVQGLAISQVSVNVGYLIIERVNVGYLIIESVNVGYLIIERVNVG